MPQPLVVTKLLVVRAVITNVIHVYVAEVQNCVLTIAMVDHNLSQRCTLSAPKPSAKE
jgi:hypothetical protein